MAQYKCYWKGAFGGFLIAANLWSATVREVSIPQQKREPSFAETRFFLLEWTILPEAGPTRMSVASVARLLSSRSPLETIEAERLGKAAVAVLLPDIPVRNAIFGTGQAPLRDLPGGGVEWITGIGVLLLAVAGSLRWLVQDSAPYTKETPQVHQPESLSPPSLVMSATPGYIQRRARNDMLICGFAPPRRQ